MSENQNSNYTYKIENVVATVTCEIKEKIDLTQIIRKFEKAEYNPERFPGLVFHLDEPKSTFLIFSTGKMVVTGLRQSEDAKPAVKKIIKMLSKCKIDIENEVVTIQNIVASGDLHVNIDLNLGAVVLEYAMYEPEVFPGLIYRMKEPKSVFLLFSTGKVVCTGCKTKEDVELAMHKLTEVIKDTNISKSLSDESIDDSPDDSLDEDENGIDINSIR